MPGFPLFGVTLAGLLLAQTGGIVPPSSSVPTPPTPASPQRIEVGSNVQGAYLGPAALWFRSQARALSESRRSHLEQILSVDPGDMCARGFLIASRRSNSVSGEGSGARVDPLLWMILHRPEWDGFLLDPKDSVAEPRSSEERRRFSELTEAWFRQIGPDQRSARVLHNAAMFFAIREPERSVALLERAVRLEPQEPLYRERLGMVYACAALPDICPIPGTSVRTERRDSFGQLAESALRSTDNWLLVGGALAQVTGKAQRSSGVDLAGVLSARFRMLTGRADLSDLWKLPFRSSRYRGTECDTSSRLP